MFTIKGKYNTATVYARTTDSVGYAQALKMCNLEELKESTLAFMPDMHAGEGCVIGTTMTYIDKVNPCFVGEDIGCGMQVYKVDDKKIDYGILDRVIRNQICSGAAIYDHAPSEIKSVDLSSLHCKNYINNDIVGRSFGSLGGGNHFIEIGNGMDNNNYLIIHSGSRRLGKDVARYYKALAMYEKVGYNEEKAQKNKMAVNSLPPTLKAEECFLSGNSLENYLNDLNIVLDYAKKSRQYMGEVIIKALNLNVIDSFATIHNYIDTSDKILRKGSVSAKKGETLLIPINMKDGSLICKGKGNSSWNYSAPHGSGRVMRRSEAKKQILLNDYIKEMEGIYTTSVSESTLDESPFAYRRIEEIIENIEPTVEIEDILTPCYNYKASKFDMDENTSDGND